MRLEQAMGIVLNRLDFRRRYADYYQGLFLVGEEKRLPKDQPVVNLGQCLSLRLAEIPKEQRQAEVSGLLRECLPAEGNLSLVRIQLLFTEYLKLDVLRELLSLARNRKICVHWPGAFQNGVLTYAESGVPEYYECNLKTLNDMYYVEE